MKKLLLFALALCFGFAVVAQKQYNVNQDTKTWKVPSPSEMAISADPVGQNGEAITKAKQPVYPGNTDNTEIVTIVDIGSAANVFTYGYGNMAATFTWYNKDLNAVTNFHRMGGDVGPPGQYSGDLCYDISLDGGMTWTSQVKVYESNISGGTYNIDAARYPQGAIYNPAGNTDPANAYMAFFAATMDGSNGGNWGSYGYGVGNLVNIDDTTKHLATSDLANGYYQGVPTAFTITQPDGVAIMADASLLDSYTEYLGDIIFYRGEFNDGIGDYEYEKFLVPAPAEYARNLKMAFDPTGQIGYVYWNDENGSISMMTGWNYPLLIKSTDAGETWSDVISVEISGPDGIDAVKNWLPDDMIQNIWDPPYPTRDEIMYSTVWFNSDIAVDAWGNPHLACTPFIAGPGLDPGYIIITPESFAVFDVYSIDDDNEDWQAVHLGTLNTYSGEFLYPGSDPLTEYNRVEVSGTTDGTKMFFTWADTRLEGVDDNTAPDIYARGFDLFENTITYDESGTAIAGATNVTAFSGAMWQAYFKSTSHYTKDDGPSGSKVYTIPMVYCDMNPQNVVDPVQFKYIQDFSFADGDFVLPTGNDPISPVGIDDPVEYNITSVSQNYPNPFNTTTTVVANIDRSSDLSLIVTNLIGQKVIEINKGEVSGGAHTFTIEAGKLQTGIYFYTVIAGDHSVTRKMIVE